MVSVSRKSKEKPKAAPEADPELFNKDLDWYYNCFDSECGHQSPTGHMLDAQESNVVSGYMQRLQRPPCDECGGTMVLDGAGAYCTKCDRWQSAVTMPVKQEMHTKGADPYEDHHVRLSSEESERGAGSFTKGRRIWSRLVRLSWAVQQDLRLLYEHRRERPQIGDERTRAAHRAYLGATHV